MQNTQNKKFIETEKSNMKVLIIRCHLEPHESEEINNIKLLEELKATVEIGHFKHSSQIKSIRPYGFEILKDSRKGKNNEVK